MAASLTRAVTDPACTAPPALRRRALTRAADLTPDGAERARRHLAAAQQALLVYHTADALHLLEQARDRSAPASVRGGAELVRGAVLLADGPVEDARESFLLAGPAAPARRRPRDARRGGRGLVRGRPHRLPLGPGPRPHTPDPPSGRGLRPRPEKRHADGPGRPCGTEGRDGTPYGVHPAYEPPQNGTTPTDPVPDVDPSRDHRDGLRAVLLARFDLAAAPSAASSTTACAAATPTTSSARPPRP